MRGSGGSVAGAFSVRSVWARERSRSIPGMWSRRLRGRTHPRGRPRAAAVSRAPVPHTPRRQDRVQRTYEEVMTSQLQCDADTRTRVRALARRRAARRPARGVRAALAHCAAGRARAERGANPHLDSKRSGGARWPSRSSKPVRRGNPTLGRFDSCAAPLGQERLGYRRNARRECSPVHCRLSAQDRTRPPDSGAHWRGTGAQGRAGHACNPAGENEPRPILPVGPRRCLLCTLRRTDSMRSLAPLSRRCLLSCFPPFAGS